MNTQLNAGLGIMENYAADVAVTMMFGIGYYLFKGMKKRAETWSDPKENLKNLKGKLAGALEKWQYAKNIEDYNNLIKSDYEGINDPFSIINIMIKKGIIPTIETYNALLMNCLVNNNEFSDTLKEEILDPMGPVTPNVYTLTVLIKGHSIKYKNLIKNEKNNLKSVQQKFDSELVDIISSLESRNVYMDVVSQNAILDALVEMGRLEDAWNQYKNMKKFFKPDIYTYTTLIKGIKQTPELSGDWLTKAFEILDEVKSSSELDEEFSVSLLEACVKFNRIDKAEELFLEIKDKLCVSPKIYNVMIKAYSKSYKLSKCDEMFNHIKELGTPNSVNYANILNAYIRCKNMEKAERIIDEMTANNVEKTMNIYSILQNGYRITKNYEKSIDLYNSVKHMDLNTAFYNSILDSCVESQNYIKMDQIFSDMINKPALLDDTTYSIVIKGYIKSNNIDKVDSIYSLINNSKDIKLDEAIYKVLIDSYVKQNNEEKVLSIYSDMKKNNISMSVMTYGVFIKLYCNKGDCNKAFELFDECVKNNIKPSVVIYYMLIKLQIKFNYIDRAITLFRNMMINEIKGDHMIYELIIKTCLENGRDKEASEFIILSLNDEIKVEMYLFDMLSDCFNYNFNNELNANDKSEICLKILNTVREKNMPVDKRIFSVLSGFVIKQEFTQPRPRTTLNNKISYPPEKEFSIYDVSQNNNIKPTNEKVYNKQTNRETNNKYKPYNKEAYNYKTYKNNKNNNNYGEEKSIYS